MNKNFFSAIYQIIKTGHWITDHVGIELKEYDVTEPQFNVLRILRGARGKPVAVQDILDKMVQRTSNVTRIVDKLLAKGYVNRHECPTNRRKMDITITNDGLAILKKLDRKVSKWHKPMMENLTEKELDTLSQLIIKLKSKTDTK